MPIRQPSRVNSPHRAIAITTTCMAAQGVPARAAGVFFLEIAAGETFVQLHGKLETAAELRQSEKATRDSPGQIRSTDRDLELFDQCIMSRLQMINTVPTQNR